jgi:hypothetical protein
MKESLKFVLKEEWRDEVIDDLCPRYRDFRLYRVPVKWIPTSYKQEDQKLRFGQGERKAFLGFCMGTERLIKIQPADPWGVTAAVLIRDVYAGTENGKPTECEEGRRCLNIDCPLNHTTKESFVVLTGIDEKAANKMSWETATSYRKLTWEAAEKEYAR